MKLIYKNKRGSLTFGGGSQSDFNITGDIEGLGPVDKTVNTITYYGMPGADTTNMADGTRAITFSGDLLMTTRAQYSYMMSVLSAPGVLTVELPDGEKRLIDVTYTSVTPTGKQGTWRTYTVQLNCDYPYFRSSNEIMFRAYEKIDHVDSSFTLPGVFTTEYSNTILNYAGNASAEPGHIWIYAEEKDKVDFSSDDGVGVLISNVTNGESIKLEYPLKSGDLIKINVAERSITNQNGTELMRYVNLDTFFDGFHLEPGENRIKAYNYQRTLDVTIRIFYTDYFVEAVF